MILYSQLSKTGDRKTNEDKVDVFDRDERYLFALADGLGGHSNGEIASALVISKAIEIFESAPGEDCLAICFIEAQNSLIVEQQRQNIDMKTTLVLLCLSNERVVWGHIGDSRLYVFYNGEVINRTSDHSVPQMLALTGEIHESDIRFHPDRNRLLRVMGEEWDSPRFELSAEHHSTPGTSYLLCSDGFWELINEKDMCRYLKSSGNPIEWLALMEKKILKNGKNKNMDNYSAIAVWA